MDQGAPCSRFLPCPDHPSPDVIAQIVARGYWDWHVEENGGPPAQDFKALLAVARACLKREYPPDEIVDAMKRERFRSITAKRVIERIGEMRRAAQDRPSTVAIPSTVVKAINAATPFFVSRWSGRWCGAFKAKLMEAVAAQLRRNYSIGETMIRLAIAMREIDLDDPFWLTNVNIPRSDADLTDIPGDMERAYVNRTWTWR